MSLTKFSAAELSILTDQHFFHHKQKTDNKIKDVFRHLKHNLEVICADFSGFLPPVAFSRPGRTSRGEYYEGLPWRALDFPAAFSKAEIFAFRTVLIWSKSLTLNFILKGKALDATVLERLEGMRQSHPDFQIWTYPQLWKWDTGADFHTSLSQWDGQLPQENGADFLRIVQPVNILELATLPEIAPAFLREVLTALYQPSREK